jgi:Ca2+-binding EF-hand superfamily protein
MVDNHPVAPVDEQPLSPNPENKPLTAEEIAQFNEILFNFITHHQTNRLEELFNLFDRNKNGSLSPLEIKTVMEQVSGHGFTDENLQHLLSVVDKNHDGLVDIREFIACMKHLTD